MTSLIDNNLWDDSELIRAYNTAVKLGHIKTPSDSTETPPPGPWIPLIGSNAKNRSTNEKSLKNEQSNVIGLEFKIGSWCRGTYDGDGKEYEAEISSIIDSTTCSITFIGYKNEQVVEFVSLKPSHGPKARANQETESSLSTSNLCSNDEMMGFNKGAVPPFPISILNSSQEPSFKNGSLASLLMSWYTAGYHAGFFDSKQEMKRKNKNSTTQ